ncbi:uncharacterized protein LOC143597216 [Bidens hawaiensis]|uniref:uncharacterized protein LOC143593145 n=1 Tax=Bidens hawaiensis TaxID=980011 RepID=UPI00404B40F9
MAYYEDGHMWTQEHTTSFPLAHQDPVSFSSYEPYGDHVDTNYDAFHVSVFDQEPKSIDPGDYEYDYDYDNNYDNYYDYGNCNNSYSSANPAINYIAQNYMEPKLIAYEPVECDTGYVRYHTQYSISYPKADLEFNEPEFEEYDPTPYGGGYDIESVYGKPVPPSNQTCYPRSKPKPTGPGPTPNSELEPQTKARPVPTPTPTPIPQPKPEHESKPMSIPTPIAVVEPKPKPEPEPKPESEPVNALVPVLDPVDLSEMQERVREEYSYPGYGYDYPWPEYDNANATRVGYDYGYGRQVVQIPPYEYSPEVVDFCESIFGNWPCLARIRKQQMSIDNNPRMSGPETKQLSPWEECAGYIFGRPMASYNV